MKKPFDCVELQHRGGERTREKLKGLSFEEQVAYWKRRTEDMKERQRVLLEKRRTPDAAVRS